MNIPLEIQEAIKNNRLVIFAGSGLSTKFKLPSWKELTKNVINNINEKKFDDLLPVLESGILTPIEVLDKIQSEHTKVRSYIKQNFKIDKNQDFLLHKKILEVTDAIITTNYDNAFEEACSNSIIPSKSTSNFNISEITKSSKSYIFKLHGCYTEPDNCIIFSDDYRKLYGGDTSSKEKLKSIFINKTILFVGFSFNDPDINLIFSSLDTIFDNHNHHYILTKEENGFEKYKFLKSLIIQDYETDIDTFFENCLDFKKELKNSFDEIAITNKKEFSKIPRIAFLKPLPLDLLLDSELSVIENCLDDLNINLFTGYLNTRTLESIDDYDILIIATKVFKDKLYIEDDNLKSDLMTAEEICNHIPNDKIPIIFITNDKIELVSNFHTINISTYKRAIIRKFAYKALRNKDLEFNPNEEISIGLSKLTTLEFTKGSSKKSSIYSNNRVLDIGEKSLKNIIGRTEEQASIISKLHNIVRSNKVLNIKASGGTGKTTLIKKVSYELYNRGYFKEGVSFNSCENIKSLEDFEELLNDAFNLRNIINFKEYLIENYSSRKLDALIILDNFETVANSLNDLEYNEVIDLIKFATDFANIVITSREKIPNLDDFEDLYSLAPLATDDALSLFELDYGKVENESEIRILRQEILEELLNNNPLAIKLVTKSRTRFKHISELRDQIKEHFFESLNEDFSSVFKHKADLNIERTKSIYQSINYSYTTLNSKEKIAFELLSLFPDGIGLSNFKKCFEKKTSSNNISDKELRILRNKSLVEDYNGTLQLQPIIRRFAEYQFSKKQNESKQIYCLDAYMFNCHILELIELIERKKNTSEALKVYNYFKNNLLNVFSYIPNIQLQEKGPVPEKKYLLNYIYDLEDFIVNEKQIKEFYKKLNSTKEYFNDLPHAETLIKVIKLNKTYFFEEFENSYSQLSLLFTPEELENRNLKNEEYIESRYKNIIASIHNMEGHTISKIKSHIANDDFSQYLDASFFYLGIPNTISRQKDGFYFFEYELMFNRLNVEQLENYISSLYLEEHLEIMQSTYTLSKIKKIDRKELNKLVVTNPYTKGLKDLMLAFISDSIDEKHLLFKKALHNLSHIKYYYLEALYFYCKYLKESKNDEYDKYINEGLELSKKYYYRYIHHLFDNLYNNKNSDYSFTYSFYPVNELEEYVNKHNEKWEKTFKERATDY
ncbi:SIR2 family protein [Flavobacterium sp. HJJ]|uniref:SIR2 family protein n=1 Tax=Flavobacterium sp. HJJ TaxID=2783792 RepID=UPI00188A9A64|nr:SIR2 family protein [Flavobacterium sp. HJJ]MBF4471550.1 SIR2 family protein [Flavobacterium sp. HJJ]